MSKVYVLRELAFMYDDQCYSTSRVGGIVGQYTDEAEARAEKATLEYDRLQMFPLREYIQFCYTQNQEKLQVLHSYLSTLPDVQIVEYHEERGAYSIKRDIYLPSSLTREQLVKFMSIMDVEFYELTTFDDPDPVYYILWIPRLGHPIQLEIDYSYRGDGTPKDISPVFCESREKAHQAIRQNRWLFNQIPFEDSFENLSEQPELLKSYVEGKDSFKVVDGKLSLNYDLISEEIVGLNALLKEPLFELRTISLEEAAKISHDPFAML